MTHQKNRFKIKYSLAYTLKNIQTEELRYYHSSYNNAQMLDTTLLISNRKDLMDFLNAFAEEFIDDGLRRPDTKWKIVQIPNIIFYVNNLKDAPFGARVTFPDHIKNNHGLLNVSGDNNVWLSIETVTDGDMNAMLRSYSMIIACILKLRIVLSRVLIYPILLT